MNNKWLAKGWMKKVASAMEAFALRSTSSWLLGGIAAALLGMSGTTHAATAWSAQDYDLYPGDFNGDNKTDLLYVAKDPANPSGIALSDGTAPNTAWQSWPSNYLGIPWSGNQYTIIVADFNGDKKADIFLQRATAGDSYLLLTDSGGHVAAISQTIANDALGYTWSADQHKLMAGDFNGDGKADLFLQATNSTGLSAILMADANGQFTASSAIQSWNDTNFGFNWSTQSSNVYVGDFNGDGKTDLLVQARPLFVMIDYDITFPVPTYPPNKNGVVYSQGGSAPFQQTGVQQWSRMNNGVDWSPLTNTLVVGDFNGDGKADVLFQPKVSGTSAFYITGNATGAAFSATATAITSNVSLSSDSRRLITGNWDGAGGVGLYVQTLTPAGDNSITNTVGTTTNTTAHTLAAGTVTNSANTVPVTAVGRTSGSFAVSNSGMATYSIPITVPAGVANMQPQLALSYQSGGGNGYLGVGWSLSGLSEIDRCRKTLAQDGTSGSVTLTSSDVFCLDGNRLRVTGGTYGQSGSTYQTEMETFSRITANGTAGTGPAWFKVETKSGLIYEYGNTADSLIESTASGYITTARVWLLNKVSDRAGNTMTVSYTEDGIANGGSYRPSEINYTSNAAAGLTAAYKIKFVWEQRPASDVTTAFFAGGVVKENYRLSRIETQYNDPTIGAYRLARKYQLSYGVSALTQRSRLAAVQECGADGTCLAPTLVNWQDGTAGLSSTEAVATSFSYGTVGQTPPAALSDYQIKMIKTYYLLDVNGDGRTDLVYPNVGTSNWAIAFANASGGYNAPMDTGIAAFYYDQAMPIDYNADGKMDLLVPDWGNSWSILQSTGTGFTVVSTGFPASGAGGSAYVGDFDGDGRQDLIYLASGSIYVRLNGPSGFSASPIAAYQQAGNSINTLPAPTQTTNVLTSTVMPADFNGDGKLDIVVTGTFTQLPYYQGMGGYTNTYKKVLYSTGASYVDSGINIDNILGVRTQDVNGDGIADLVYICQRPGTNSTWCVRSGTGAGLAAQVDSQKPLKNESQPGIAIDWDQDGRTDLLQPDVNGAWWWYRATGDVNAPFADPIAIASSMLAPMNMFIPGNYQVADVNGDGLADVVYNNFTYMTTNSNGYVTLVVTPLSNYVKYHLNVGVAPDLATNITDGFGNAVTVTYAPMTDSSVYSVGSGATYPEVDVTFPMPMVKSYTSTDGVGSNYTTTERYAGARIDLKGRGFEGFASRTETDSRTGIYTTTTFNQLFPYSGTASGVTVRQPNGKSISENYVSYADMAAGTVNNDRHFPYQTNVTQTTYEQSSDVAVNGQPTTQIVKTFAAPDAYGNTTATTVTTYDMTAGLAVSAGSVVTASAFNNDTANWCLGFVTQQQVQSTVPALTTQTRTTQFVPDANAFACRNAQQMVEPNDATVKVTTTLGYDVFGHVTQQRTSAAGIADRVTTTSYGAQGVLPVSVTNAANETASKTFDYALDVPLTATDPNGITVTWKYDGFGRKTFERRADGTSTLWTLSPCGISNGYCGDSLLRYQVQEQPRDAAGNVISTGAVLYDSMGRGLYKMAQTLSGATSVVRTQYDNRGLVTKRSMPYFNGFAPTYTTTYYDLLGRVIKEERAISDTNAALQNNTYIYARLVNTFTDANGKSTKKFYNALGQVVQVNDPANGNTYYTYDPFGNLLTTKDPLGNTIVNTYNLRGHKLTTSDPDMGKWVYTYYPTGELKTQTDAKSQQATFTYDNVSRPLTRTEPEGVTTWTYGTTLANRDIGKPISVTSPGGYAEVYAYDSLGRAKDVTTTADGSSYVISSTYSATTGLLETMTYPTSTTAVPGSRFKVQYDYAYGVLKDVKDYNTPSTLYWQQIATNAAGQTVDEQFGNGLHGYSTWDSITGLLSLRSAGAGAAVQNLSYQWDRMGNLTERKDTNQALTEDFVYDNLNRLDHSTLTASGIVATNLSMGYAANGNITSKSDVGSSSHAYDYITAQAGCTYYADHSQPHAVRNAGGNAYCYDANGNMTRRTNSAISWSSYNLPTLINQGSNSSQFWYGAGRNRYKQVAITAAGGALPAGTETTIYVGSLFEKVTKPSGVMEYKHYVMAGKEPIAIKTLRTNSANDVRYLHKDHLGSIDTITDESGSVVARLSADAFGQRRNTTGWSGAPSAANLNSIVSITHRAFTGHEQLDNVSLIHMNGRVYDPLIGRFISADPTIQAPLMSQSLNRYSYVMNNPLSMTDPSGFSWLSKALHSVGHFIHKYWRAIVAIVVSVVSFGILAPYMSALMATNMCLAAGTITMGGAIVAGAITGAIAGAILGGARGALVGALSGAMFGGIGAYYGNTWTVGRVAANAVAGGVSSSMAGGSFEKGAELSLALSLMQWGAQKMSTQMTEAAAKNKLNTGVDSDGNPEIHSRGGIYQDNVKDGGGWASAGAEKVGQIKLAPFGGAQGGVGHLFGQVYKAGSWQDFLVESYSGSHDWLSQLGYNMSNGTMAAWTQSTLGGIVDNIYVGINLFPATAFAAAAVAPEIAYMPRDRS